MLELTPGDVINRDWDELDPEDIPYCVYEITEDNTTLYVGSSTSPFNRIMEHFGWLSRGNHQIQMIHKSYPDIVTRWKVRFYTLQDCEMVTLEHFNSDYPDLEAKNAEIAMIQKLHPCLNGTYNSHPSELPERYRRVFLDLDNNAVDYLNF